MYNENQKLFIFYKCHIKCFSLHLLCAYICHHTILYTYLGLIIDNKFNWTHQIDHVCNKLRQFLAVIKIIKNRIPFKVKLLLYYSLAHSYIQYGLESYGRTYKTYLDKIYNLQVKIIKNFVSNNILRKYHYNESELFTLLKILPVHSQLKFNLLKKYFFCNEIKIAVEHPVHTRTVSRKQLRTIRANNAYGERTSAYLVPRIVNDLPLNVCNVINKENIKKVLKKYFVNSI